MAITTPKCCVPGCNRDADHLSRCQMHYTLLRREARERGMMPRELAAAKSAPNFPRWEFIPSSEQTEALIAMCGGEQS